ncbi:MAG: hypothetical protein P4M00_15065 [Azospirillaceae bacterium]|nr:hypothetical protein [Azospirillaceae bacterium]
MTVVTNNQNSDLSGVLALFSQGAGSSATGTGSTSANAEVSGSSATAREAAVIVTLSERAKGVMATGSTDSSSGVAAAISAIQDIVKGTKAGSVAANESSTAAGSSGTIWQALDSYYGGHQYSTPPTSVGSVKTVGTVGTAGWSTTLTDVYTGPADTNDKQKIDQWYNNSMSTIKDEMSSLTSEQSQSLWTAFQNRTLKIANAFDVPDINYHNSTVYYNNRVGGSTTGSVSATPNAAMTGQNAHAAILGSGVYVEW